MRYTKHFLFILLLLLSPSYLVAVDACLPNNDHSVTLSSSNASDTFSSTASSKAVDYKYIYVEVAESGTVDISVTGSAVLFSYNKDICPSAASGVTSLSISGVNDFNILVYATNAASHDFTLNMTFSPSVPPIMGTISNKICSTGASCTYDISGYATRTDSDPITGYYLSYIPDGLSFDTTTGILSGYPHEINDINISALATDKDGDSNTSTFTLTVNEVGAAANDDSFTVIQSVIQPLDGTFTSNVMDNDYGLGKEVTTYTPIDSYIIISNDGTFTYTPDANFTGIYTFSYTIKSDNSTSGDPTDDTEDNATVTIQVLAEPPEFCYGYTYKQNGIDFTEDNNGTEDPRLVNNGSNTLDDIDMTIYIQNLSTLTMRNLSSEIVNINTSEVAYASASKTFAEDGPINQYEYFYIKYLLTPQKTDFNTSIELELTLLDLNGYQMTLNSQYLPLCTYAGSSSAYNSQPRIFNVIHNDYYANDNLADGQNDSYYNIPTQVVKREGNFSIISLDGNISDGIDILTPVSTGVAVDLIQADYYNDSEASCQDENSAISKRVWLTFDNNISIRPFNKQTLMNAIAQGTTDLATSSEFYEKAGKNVAFRVSYNVTVDGADLIDTAPGAHNPSLIQILNFTELVQDIKYCRQPVTMSNGSVTELVPVACRNTGTKGITQQEFKICMECIYGLNTKYACSRDNFAIRPEAFLMKIDDQNQTTGASQVALGTSTATPIVHNMAADYRYNIEINATNHINTSASLGYTAGNTYEYLWEPRAGHIVTGCNDDTNKSIPASFVDGFIDTNTTLAQVGEYRLHVTDTTWTTVDFDPIYMNGHHIGAYFLSSTITDCIVNSSVTQLVNSSSGSATPLIGCDINSTHTNTETGTVYNDYNVTFHPFKFDLYTLGLEMNASVGLTPNPITPTSYVYMADMSKDQNMSYHLSGYIRASGYYDSNLSNFVGECYAKPIDINITKAIDINNTLAYQYRFNTLNVNDINISTTSGDLNNTTGPVQIYLSEGNFTDLNGSINSNLNLNFFREVNSSKNPRVVNFGTYRVDCKNADVNCTFNADLIPNKTTNGTLTLDHNITHNYGRTHAQRHRFVGPTGSAFIYYEAFCNGTDTNGISCNKVLLPNGVDSNSTNDPRWFKNTSHVQASYGIAGNINQKGFAIGAGHIDTSPSGTLDETTTGRSIAALTYDVSQGYPYIKTMENNASNWLIYNKYDANDTKNEFVVEFVNDGNWTGENETSVTTKNRSSIITNRRSMW